MLVNKLFVINSKNVNEYLQPVLYPGKELKLIFNLNQLYKKFLGFVYSAYPESIVKYLKKKECCTITI